MPEDLTDPASTGGTGDGSPGSAGTWCDQCGAARAEGDHARCCARRDLEPPRYCDRCRRRMVVQVLPRGWSARCVQHGTRAG